MGRKSTRIYITIEFLVMHTPDPTHETWEIPRPCVAIGLQGRGGTMVPSWDKYAPDKLSPRTNDDLPYLRLETNNKEWWMDVALLE